MCNRLMLTKGARIVSFRRQVTIAINDQSSHSLFELFHTQVLYVHYLEHCRQWAYYGATFFAAKAANLSVSSHIQSNITTY